MCSSGPRQQSVREALLLIPEANVSVKTTPHVKTTHKRTRGAGACEYEYGFLVTRDARRGRGEAWRHHVYVSFALH
jgi:hypothetical protein